MACGGFKVGDRVVLNPTLWDADTLAIIGDEVGRVNMVTPDLPWHVVVSFPNGVRMFGGGRGFLHAPASSAGAWRVSRGGRGRRSRRA